MSMLWFDILILRSVLLRKDIMAVILIGLTICGVKGQKPSWGEAQAENLLVFYDKRFQLTVYGWQLFKAPPPLVTWWTAGENICPKSQLRFAKSNQVYGRVWDHVGKVRMTSVVYQLCIWICIRICICVFSQRVSWGSPAQPGVREILGPCWGVVDDLIGTQCGRQSGTPTTRPPHHSVTILVLDPDRAPPLMTEINTSGTTWSLVQPVWLAHNSDNSVGVGEEH